MKTIASLLLIIQAPFLMAQSPSAFGKKVKNMPKRYEKPYASTYLSKEGSKGSSPWVVFSDRDDNFTTTAPGGSLVMKKLNFMEPFYVSDEKNGYLKLIKYQAGMLKGRKVMDKKTIVSCGWISKSKMLLWHRSYTNQKSGFAEKSIAIISGTLPMTASEFYYDHTDSVYVYNSPELKKHLSKVRLHEISYIFKKSEDGKKYLIGNEDQLVADSARRSIYGWVAADAVHNWGDRLYISPSAIESDELADSASMRLHQTHADPLLNAHDILLRSAPVISDAGSKGLSLGMAADVYDKSGNGLVTINGSLLSYLTYLEVRKHIHKVNIIFVIDGGSTMARYFSGLTNTIRSFENIFGEYRKKQQLSFGAVVYRDNGNCVQKGLSINALSPDYRKLTGFLAAEAEKTKQCNGIIGAQPVYDGIRSALDTLKKHQYETNLVVLIGSTGDQTTTESVAKFKSLTEDFGRADARLLSIQVYSDYNQIFNNFVLQSKKLVSEAAIFSADQKKNFLIKGEGLINTQIYNTSQPDSISYYLDYPKNSLIQGGVVFPTKGSVNSSKSMNIALKRILKETDEDINDQISSLDSAFRLTGIMRKNLSAAVESQLPPPLSDQVADQMPHNAFKYYMTSDVPADVVEKNKDLLQYALVISTAELKQLNEIMSLMIGQNLQPDQSSFRRKLFKNYLNIVRKSLDMKLSRGKIRSMTLPGYLKTVTGMPVVNEQMSRYTVKDLKNKMPQPDFEAWLKFLMNADSRIKRETQIGQQFISNGKTYYYILQQNFMLNPEKANP